MKRLVALLAFVAGAMAVSTLFAPNTASASGLEQASCSVSVDGTFAGIEIENPVEGRLYRVWRHGHQIDLQPVFNPDGDIVALLDTAVLNRPVVHYSIQVGSQGNDLPRVYCGSVQPSTGSCTVSMLNNEYPFVEMDGRQASYVWRNGARVQSTFGGDERIFAGRSTFHDESARFIGQVNHYSAEWSDGTRTYCGSVTVPGAPFTCNLSMYYEGFPYVRIQPNFSAAAAPGRPVVYRNGHIIATTSFPDETNGRLDPTFTPDALSHYSLGWITQEGRTIAPVYCGSITPPPADA